MLILETNILRTKILGDDPHKDKVVDAIDDYIAYDDVKAMFKPSNRIKKKQGFWDGKIHPFSRCDYSFPTGFLPYVKDTLNSFKVEYEVRDISGITLPAKLSIPELEGIGWYGYQERSVRIALQVPYRGIIWVGTGGGKTPIGIGIAKAYNRQTLWLTHKKDLLQQTYDRFKEFWPEADIGMVGNGVKDYAHQIVIATVQTLDKLRLETWVKNLRAGAEVLILERQVNIGDMVHKTNY